MNLIKKIFSRKDTNPVINRKDPPKLVGQMDPPEIKPKVDRHGLAEMMYNTAIEMFSDADDKGDDDRKMYALKLLEDCVEKYPEYVKSYCSLCRVFMYVNNLDAAFDYAARAYKLEPENEEVCGVYASCFAKKGSLSWDEGDLRDALDAYITALKLNGFEIHAFAASRYLAKELSELEYWAGECVALGIDPLQEIDVSQLRATDQ
jgi:tetratricopeptide (TPR) repeat protein